MAVPSTMRTCSGVLLMATGGQSVTLHLRPPAALSTSDGSATLKLRYVLQTMNYNSTEALLRSLLWCEKTT